MNQALDQFLSLVYPSGQLLFGFDNLKKIRANRVKLIVIINSASQKTKLSVVRYAQEINCEYLSLNPETIPQLVAGKNLAVFAILDANIAKKIKKLVKEGDTYE